jgi:rubrerythrin
MPKKFTRTIEDFVCQHCGAKVKGTGYTNHCPNCLYSKHVDVNPGDRTEICSGMMKPMAVEIKSGNYILVHQCQKCGLRKKNKTAPEDNFENILKIIPSTP